ncbi:bifunctional 3-(3-hydroxy-phenyl)propionate/3-hydroxycinnamic acid hydroxylase [Streptomyces sp. CS014]|uniref:bifunctional 3-(3-hydroxy-phenyl)propionate/3-hydroxycinnamic acid hydroxylase MhpA n=1 Tax=Streptomyces sp. CS014 TaxID=2162707 RepID=UPI000D508DB5|nr:bifunctional 3-(3-hydroxy-phenyl)propionate/3-hydroxycinnamic acid hydroxylase [Streptomyces sp. CS014]PVD02973.1 3-(3-hydroxyphenyl)propionate hydroxylase [Streptomyces sp. CS014]
MHPSPRPADGPPNTGTDTDVLIVGHGPVGQLLAIQLVRLGWRVTVVERWLTAYPMPRAVAFDSEGARLLAAAGMAEAIGEIGEPSGDYTWKNAAGQALLHIDVAERGLCGWPESTSMYQPALEAALTAHGATFPGLTVLRGHEAVGLVDHGDHVELTARTGEGEERVITAGWVVGCDGANSFVRKRIGGEVTDFGFSHDWLICDVVLHEEREFRPNNLQICDPARPRTSVSAGPGHRRWEFMRVAGESVEELNTPESAWRLLSMFDVTPGNATLERHHVYSFSAASADRWRSGRMLVAGDAAHVMPPFAGQGMTAGFRDVTNLVWKLDAVMRGDVDESFLDTYALERRPHVKHAIGMSVNLGRIICQTDPSAAADRDMVMLAAAQRATPAAAAQQRSPFQPLKGGFLHRAASGRPLRPAGQLIPQARVARGSEAGLFDGVVGTGFVLLATEEPAALLEAEGLEFLQALGARLVQVLPAGTPPGQVGDGAVVDVEDVYLPYLAEAGAAAALVRPDFYVYGAARDRAELAAVVEGMRAQLSLPAGAAALTP